MDVRLDLESVDVQVAPAVDLSAYRLVQEALTNCMRHAGPASVQVGVGRDGDHLAILVRDDGVGDTVPAQPGGHGLVAMRERVALLGGTLHVGPRPGGGWSVETQLPLAAVAVP